MKGHELDEPTAFGTEKGWMAEPKGCCSVPPSLLCSQEETLSPRNQHWDGSWLTSSSTNGLSSGPEDMVSKLAHDSKLEEWRLGLWLCCCT